MTAIGNKSIDGLLEDIEGLDQLNETLTRIRAQRLQEKYPTRGSYRKVDVETILENLGRNTVQFTMVASQMGINDSSLDSLETELEAQLWEQGADIVNLVLMVIDHKREKEKVTE